MHSDYFSRVLIVTAILVTIKERVTSSTTTENANCTFTTVSSLTNALNLTSNSIQRVKLSIAGFYSRGKSWDTSGVIPAVELALDHINHRADILEDYELDVIWENSNCRVADGIWAFHQQLVKKPQKMMLLGPACSIVTQPIAETALNGNLLTVSYASTSPMLSIKDRFPYFFRTCLSETLLNLPKIWLMEYFNWTRIGALTQNHEWFISTHNHLLTTIAKKSIEVEVSEIIDNIPTARQLNKLKEEDLRIFVVLSYGDTTKELFCQIYKAKLYGKGFVWIIPGWFNDHWWTSTTNTTSCTNEEVETAVVESRYISVESSDFRETSNENVSNLTAAEFKTQFEDKRREVENRGYNITPSRIEPFGYDALWAIALTLNGSLETLAKKGHRLEKFTYNDSETGKILFTEMNSTNFVGLTGHISFLHGDRKSGPVNIEQLQEFCEDGWTLFRFYCYKEINENKPWEAARQHCTKLQHERHSSLVSILNEQEYDFLRKNMSGEWFIGLTYNKSLEKLVWLDTNDKALQWRPKDFEDSTEKCHVWNTTSGWWKSIDCSSSRRFICKSRADAKEVTIFTLNSGEGDGHDNPIQHAEFIWHGGVIPLDRTPTVEIGLTPDTYGVICSVAVLGIVLAIGFLAFNVAARKHKFVKLSSPRFNNLIIFGGILIYLSVCILGLELIDENGERQKVGTSCMSRAWLSSIGFVLGFGALFSKTWRVYKVANKRNVKRLVIKDSELFVMVGIFLVIDVIILLVWQISDPLLRRRIVINTSQHIFECDCKHSKAWLVILLVYKGIILIFGSFLSWQTRMVTIPALNDSKLIGICVYNTTVLCVVGLCVSLASPHKTVFQYLLSSAIMIYCVTVTLLVIFVPKIFFVCINPKAGNKSTGTTISSSQQGKSSQDVQLESSMASIDKRTSGYHPPNPPLQSVTSKSNSSKSLTLFLRQLAGFDEKNVDAAN